MAESQSFVSEKKNVSTESTVLGLPEVGNRSTQEMDSQSTLEPLEPVSTSPMLDPLSAPTSPTLQPVLTPPTAPPRTKTGGMKAADPPRTKTGGMKATDPPRTKTGGVVPSVDTTPRRQSRVAQATPQDSVPTGEFSPLATASARPAYEWTLPRVAGLAGGVCLIFVLTWVFWPSGKPKRQVVEEGEDAEVEQPIAVAPKPKPTPVAPVNVAPKKPTFALDAKKHVIDPYAVHLPDLELDPAHKYRLRIERDDSRVGSALARLDEKSGWGVMRKMASHAVLQFGGAKALRMHCEPGAHFQDGQTLPLELFDLANKKVTPVLVNPARHCWDFEVARQMELGEGVKKRVRVPTDSKVALGEKVTLKVAYILESLGEKKTWRTGVLSPGESVLAEGRMARFAILDPYAGDNQGTLDLEILSGDTENSGLVTPSAAAGVEFVVPTPR